MEEAVIGYLIVGALLVIVAVIGTIVERLPLTTSLFYLAAGFVLGHLGVADFDPARDGSVLERLTEVAVILSLFTTGLKLRSPLRLKYWHPPLRLASVTMMLTIAGVAAAAVWLLDFSVGHAVLLGSLLAPTDPVLASEVQVVKPGERDPLRFALTGEAGLNDGAAFPFVMLGLGLLSLHPLGEWGWRWLSVDVLWAVLAGLAIGFGLGIVVAKLVLYMRTHRREAVGFDDILALGLVALSYGVALGLHAYGFLAVFAAGLALRRIEAHARGGQAPTDVKELAAAGETHEIATDPEHAPAYMAEAVLEVNEQLERVAEIAILLVAGILLGSTPLAREVLWLAPALFFVIRPLSVFVGLAGSRMPWKEQWLIGWFGIRGIGSLYYLFFASNHGLGTPDTERLTSIVLGVVVASVVVHGVSVTPLMRRYGSATEQNAA